jgi:hypothetical protein
MLVRIAPLYRFVKLFVEASLEEDWPKVENWFQVQMERAKKK